MRSSPNSGRKLAGAIFRVVIITFLATLMSFAVALFFGIVGILLANLTHLGSVNITSAYRHFAFPVAMTVMVIAFISELTLELREGRQTRTAARERSKVA
jgi:TRAP-type C4-dicarboxylate transport system permease small subunit